MRGVTREELREAIEYAISVLGRKRYRGGNDAHDGYEAHATLRAFLDSGLEVIHNPGDLIAKVACPCCGAELEIMHGDDEGEIGVLGTGGDCALTASERETVGKVVVRLAAMSLDMALDGEKVWAKGLDEAIAALAPVVEGK